MSSYHKSKCEKNLCYTNIIKLDSVLEIKRNIMKNTKLIFCFCLALAFTSCSKSENDNGVEMVFQELSETNCGLVLALNLQDEWRNLTPININDFDIAPSAGLEVLVTFEDRTDVSIDCAFSEPIEILSISVR